MHNCLKAPSQITQFTLLGDTLAYSTKFHGLKVVSNKECDRILSFKHEFLNHETTALALSPDGKYLVFCTANRLYIIKLQTQKLLKSITSIEQTVISLHFDLSSNYIIVGTKEGRILQYKYSQSTLLARVISYKYKKINNMHGNILSSISFNDEYLISGYYDGTIDIVNLYTKIHIGSFKHANCSITTTCMINKKRFLSATSDGRIFIQDIGAQSIVKEITTPFVSVADLLLIPRSHYVLVVSSSDSISLLNLKKAKIEHIKFLTFKEDIYKVVVVNEAKLFVALKDNTILSVPLPSKEQLKSLILHNSLAEAFALAESNHMLYDTQEYSALQLQYKKAYLNAVEALINQNKNAALMLTDSFKNIPSKKEEIKLLYSAFEHYPRFQTLFLEKKYALAYNLSAKFPALQLTHQYRKMEKIFKEIFLNAQRHILLGNKEHAVALLNDYITVTAKRDLIKLILNDNRLFVEFLKATQEKNFTKVNELVQQKPLLSQIPTYKILEDSMDVTLSNIELKIRDGDIEEATREIELLKNLPYARIATLKETALHYQRLQDVYDENNFKACYEVLDSHPNLNNTKLGEMLNKHWIKIIQKCEEFALAGNIKGVKTTLKELLSLQSRKDKVGDLLRVSFHVKIEQLLAAKKFNSAQNIIYSYLDIFGSDSEISSLMKLYEDISSKKLALTQNIKISRHNWLNSEIIMK